MTYSYVLRLEKSNLINTIRSISTKNLCMNISETEAPVRLYCYAYMTGS